jgi:hypothetical protein
MSAEQIRRGVFNSICVLSAVGKERYIVDITKKEETGLRKQRRKAKPLN